MKGEDTEEEFVELTSKKRGKKGNKSGRVKQVRWNGCDESMHQANTYNKY